MKTTQPSPVNFRSDRLTDRDPLQEAMEEAKHKAKTQFGCSLCKHHDERGYCILNRQLRVGHNHCHDWANDDY